MGESFQYITGKSASPLFRFFAGEMSSVAKLEIVPAAKAKAAARVGLSTESVVSKLNTNVKGTPVNHNSRTNHIALSFVCFQIIRIYGCYIVYRSHLPCHRVPRTIAITFYNSSKSMSLSRSSLFTLPSSNPLLSTLSF